ncbi:MAG TPA: HD domain-containing protein [Acetobacteraceae bacterium]|jgi:putative nucleotidyltransferase with HDIG domain|nr:HD domain-containing protein [Acetobacteraceae bacterium]
MALHYVTQQKPITDALRRTVVEDLPEIEQIENLALRTKAIEAWAFALAHSSFGRISDIEPGGNPGMNVLKRGSQADHLRGVARLALQITDTFIAQRPEVRIDRDVVLTGALCHDVGKPYEFDSVNIARWADDPSATGQPTLRHTVFGTYVCLAVGLPEEIAHIACAHSLEGQHIGVSTECMIVRHADHAYWSVAGALGLLTPESLRPNAILRVRKLATEVAQAAE